MNEDFWERCVNTGCVVLPLKTYSAYVNDNLHESTYLGIRYAALAFNDEAVGPEYWFMIDEASAGIDNLFESPLAALEAFEKRRADTRS